MRIALVHDQLHEFGGAERVLFALKHIFPQAPIYTAFASRDRLEALVPESKDWEIRESFASRIPSIRRLYSPLRFLAPLIWESFDFSNFDVVLSSSGWYMCKGIKVKKPTIHISYMHHPPRYLYGYETAMEWQRYLPIKIYAHIVNHFLRIWDYESSQRVDYFIANSQETQKRIKKFYRRDSSVIYPSVGIARNLKGYNFPHHDKTAWHYVTLSRLARSKHIDILIKAANEHKFKLKIIGEGSDRAYLESLAGPTVELLGRVPDDKLEEILMFSKAFLFASVDEEFGIAPIEAMGYGVPVIAYKSGGLIETIKDGKNGFLFDELSEKSLIEKIKLLESLPVDEYRKMRKTAWEMSENYSEERFEKEIVEFVKKPI